MLSPTAWKILEGFCTGTLPNFVCYVYRNPREPHLHQNPLEPHQPSAPEPAGTLFAICTGTIRNHPDPHQPSAPEPSGTSSAFCTGTLWNLISFLHRNPLELSGTLRNLLQNLGLQLHRIAPELFWAKDPIASFAVGEKPMTQIRIKLRLFVWTIHNSKQSNHQALFVWSSRKPWLNHWITNSG